MTDFKENPKSALKFLILKSYGNAVFIYYIRRTLMEPSMGGNRGLFSQFCQLFHKSIHDIIFLLSRHSQRLAFTNGFV